MLFQTVPDNILLNLLSGFFFKSVSSVWLGLKVDINVGDTDICGCGLHPETQKIEITQIVKNIF
jgi:hypothetical protein